MLWGARTGLALLRLLIFAGLVLPSRYTTASSVDSLQQHTGPGRWPKALQLHAV